MNLPAALSDWTSVLGAAGVRTSPRTLAAWAKATFPWPQEPLAILAPRSAETVAACLEIATRHSCPVYPISRGRAWGLGSRLPVRSAVILDLSRLDRILDLDLEHGTVRVEPGVTFAALTRALADAGAGYHLPAFGGPPDASVLANALDRGEGTGLYGDRYRCLSDLDVVLATGERVRTGFGRHGAEGLARVHARPAGPLIEGLFSQSGFGCVVSGRLELAPNLARGRYLMLDVGDVRQLAGRLEPLRQLLKRRIVDPHDMYIWDGAKRISSELVRAEVWNADLEGPALTSWSVTMAVSAHEADIFEAKLAAARRVLAGAGDLVEQDDTSGQLDAALRGVSDGANLTSCYWEKSDPPGERPDPDRDRCGFVWICPVVPMERGSLETLVGIVNDVSVRYGTFAATGLEAVSHRALQGYVSLVWDRDADGADMRGMQAHAEIAEALLAAELMPYRLAHLTIGRLADPAGDWGAVTGRIRHALDPAGVLATGRVAGIAGGRS